MTNRDGAGPRLLEPPAPCLMRRHASGTLFDLWYDLRLLPDGRLQAIGARARRLVLMRGG